MNSSLILTPTTGMNYDQWLQFRKRGVGASEVGAILGLSEYESPMSVFYEKTSLNIMKRPENFAMFMGKYSEDFIADLWEYWQGDDQTLMANFNSGKKARRCQKVNAYIQNPKWKWLFVSLDRKINKNYFNGIQYDEGNLELKNMSGYEVQKWEFGIPASHLIQVQTQMGVCGFDYGELAIWKDGRQLAVHHFEFNKEIFEKIVDQTHDFWQRVEKAKILKSRIYEAEKGFNKRLVEELKSELMQLEPEADGNEDALSDFLTEKYKKGTAGERIGLPEELNLAIKHSEGKKMIKDLQSKVLNYENQLKLQMREIECLNFGKDGKVHWSNSSNGSRIFRNNIKA